MQLSLASHIFDFFFRNSATKSIEQSLLFCGAETGKMIALRNIIRQVSCPYWIVNRPRNLVPV